MMDRKINVTVWNEYRHELQHEACKKAYPQGIHVAVGEALLEDGAFDVNYAWLDKDAEHGLSQELWTRPMFFSGGGTWRMAKSGTRSLIAFRNVSRRGWGSLFSIPGTSPKFS